MTGYCIAGDSVAQLQLATAILPQRAIMFMGDNVKPGAYWAVRACDVAALQKAGYTLIAAATPEKSGD